MVKFPGKTVLIVDDDEDIRTAIKAALEDFEVTIKTTGNGNQAVDMIQQEVPDLLVLDQMLPGRSGFLVMEKLKRGKAKNDPPRVIMITGNQGARHKVYAQSLGVDVYLNKPFRMERLVEAVIKLIGSEARQ